MSLISSLFSSSSRPANYLDTPLLHFSSSDPYRIKDALEGILIFGATGAGKTSGFGAALSTSFLNAGFGGLILCAKADETQLWLDYCREAGRVEDLIIVSPSSGW